MKKGERNESCVEKGKRRMREDLTVIVRIHKKIAKHRKTGKRVKCSEMARVVAHHRTGGNWD